MVHYNHLVWVLRPSVCGPDTPAPALRRDATIMTTSLKYPFQLDCGFSRLTIDKNRKNGHRVETILRIRNRASLSHRHKTTTNAILGQHFFLTINTSSFALV